MKVICRNIYNEFAKKFQENSPYITIGKEYVVLSVDIYNSGKVTYRIICDDETAKPGLFNSEQFEIISNKIPSNWIITKDSDWVALSPEVWTKEGFWEACFEGEVTRNEDILAAAWLHDVLEDVAPHNENFSAEKILQTFGPIIFDIVLALTDSKVEAGNRAARKELDRKRLAAASNEAKTVKLADLIANLLDIKQHDIGFYRVIAKETALLLPYLEGGNPILFARITKILEENDDKTTHP